MWKAIRSGNLQLVAEKADNYLEIVKNITRCSKPIDDNMQYGVLLDNVLKSDLFNGIG